MPADVNWEEAVKPLLKKYKGKKHPLDYGSVYQLVVMVVLSAQDSDRHINLVVPKLFEAYPDMKALSHATPDALMFYLKGVRSAATKAKWLIDIATKVKTDSGIPLKLDPLTELPGIGRKSANVILREASAPAEGIIVDLHVIRVAPRLGIASGTDAKKIEKQMMQVLPQKEWDAGMAMSFLGREICRPEPKCHECLMNVVCEFYNSKTR